MIKNKDRDRNRDKDRDILHSWEDGEIMDMEERMPELVDDTENDKWGSTIATTDNFLTGTFE